MKVILDVMGGDNPPKEFVRGAVLAAKESDINIVLVGDETIIKEALKASESDVDMARFEIVHAEEVITMEDEPFAVLREKKNSSMAVALKLLADGKGDAFVGAGNTGAMFTGATMIVHSVKGIKRAAIATVMPFERPLLLLDAGANLNVTPDYLLQFAVMGEVYSHRVLGCEKPTVGLLNNGTEAHKGTQLVTETHKLLKDSSVNFIGNVEGKEVPYGKCDVLVTDGFTGNIVLKLSEGLSAFLMKKIKKLFMANLITKLSSVLFKKPLTSLKKEFSAKEYGGAPFLGIAKPVLKAHGNADAETMKNAILKAKLYYETGIIDEIAARAAALAEQKKQTVAEQ